MQVVKGVVALAKGQPVSVVDVHVPDPGPGEAVVQIQTCGVCHTDLHYREGGISDDYPFLLGHESAGIVAEVGEGVTEVAVGDFVILNWRAICGDCRACKRGEPWYCFATHNATQKMTLPDGTELSPALGIGAFVEKTLVHAGQCTKVEADARAAAVGLLGCGVMAGLGAAVNTGGVTRGDSVAVIGCGGVGCAAIVGSALAGAGTIIAVDLDDRKLERAKGLGATHTVNSGDRDAVEAIRELTGGFGADVVIDAVGLPATWKQAFYARDLAGTVVLVGVPHPDAKVPDIPLIDVFGRGGALKSSWYGDCLPSRDFPMLVDLYQQGRLDLDAFVTEEIGLGDVEQAFSTMQAGGDAAFGGGPMTITHLVTNGTFSLDGQTFDVDNNVWIIGDDREVIVIDAPHDVDAILDAVGGRRVTAIVCTHAHDDHVRYAPDLADRTGAPMWLHPDDEPVWNLTHPDRRWDHDLADGQEFRRRGRYAAGAAHARARPGRGVPLLADAGLRLHPATRCSTVARARRADRSAAAR